MLRELFIATQPKTAGRIHLPAVFVEDGNMPAEHADYHYSVLCPGFFSRSSENTSVLTG